MIELLSIFACLSDLNEKSIDDPMPIIMEEYNVKLYFSDQGWLMQWGDCMWKIEKMRPYGVYAD